MLLNSPKLELSRAHTGIPPACTVHVAKHSLKYTLAFSMPTTTTMTMTADTQIDHFTPCVCARGKYGNCADVSTLCIVL